jgi:hypothetical protein
MLFTMKVSPHPPLGHPFPQKARRASVLCKGGLEGLVRLTVLPHFRGMPEGCVRGGR